MCKKWTLTLALLILGCFTVWQSSSAHADYEDNLEIMDFIENNSNGSGLYYGFMLKEVGGEILHGYNIDGVNGQFYPASTIKVAHHLHVMQNENILAEIPYYIDDCTNSPNQQAGTDSIVDMLGLMMQNSNNNRTNTLQDYVGQANINNTLHNVVGMSNLTQLNHKFDCGGPDNNPANIATLKDFSLLYEGVADGTLMDFLTQEAFENLMLNETNNGFLLSRIDIESNSLGLTDDEKDEFLEHFAVIFKGGGYSWDVEEDGIFDFFYASRAGYVTIPAKTCDGIQLRKYTFGLFIDQATSINPDTHINAIRLMLKSEIRNGLETFTTPLGCVNGWINIVPGLGYDTPVPIPGMSDAVLTVPSLGLGDGVWLGTAEFTPSTAPSGYIFARQGFELKEVGTSSQLARPLTLHTPYDESLVIDETSLRWFRFDEVTGGWVDTVNVCQSGSYTQDARLNTLEAPLCQTGQYALFGTVLNPQ